MEGLIILLFAVVLAVVVVGKIIFGGKISSDEPKNEAVSEQGGSVIDGGSCVSISNNGQTLKVISAVYLFVCVIGAVICLLKLSKTITPYGDLFNPLGLICAVGLVFSGLIIRYTCLVISEGADNSVKARENTEKILKLLEDKEERG